MLWRIAAVARWTEDRHHGHSHRHGIGSRDFSIRLARAGLFRRDSNWRNRAVARAKSSAETSETSETSKTPIWGPSKRRHRPGANRRKLAETSLAHGRTGENPAL